MCNTDRLQYDKRETRRTFVSLDVLSGARIRSFPTASDDFMT